MNAGTFSLIATGLFVLVLLVGFLIGLWRGFKKSLFNAVLSIIGAVVAFFVTPIVTNAIMGIKINSAGEYIPLSQYFVNMLRRNPDIDTMMTNNPNMEAFFNKLPLAIGNTIVFIILTFAIEFVFYIIYRIFASIFMRRKKDQKMHRLGGALVGLGSFFVIFIFAFMPITSLISTADQMMTSEDYQTQTADADSGEPEREGLLNKYMPKIAVDAVKGVNGSVLSKVSGLFGLNNVLFDYYSNFTVDNQKVYIRQEVVNYYQAADFLYQIATSEEINFQKIDYDKVQDLLEKIENGGLFKSIVPSTIKELIVNYGDYSFLRNNTYIQEYQDIFDSIKADFEDVSGEALFNYIKNDIDKTFEVVKLVGENGIVDELKDLSEITAEKIADALTGEEHYESFKTAIRKVFDINVIKNSLGVITEELVEKVSEAASLDGIDDVSVNTRDWADEKWNNLTENFATTFKELSNILKQVDFEAITDFTVLLTDEIDINIAAILNSIGKLVDNVRTNELLRTEENKSIFDSFLEANDLELPEGPVKDSLNHDVTISNYQGLMNFIAPAIEEVKDNNIYTIIQQTDTDEIIEDLAGVISRNGNEDILSRVLLPFYQIKITKTKVFDQISTLDNELVNFGALVSYNDWKTDLGYISQILLALTDENAKVDDVTYLKLIVNGNFNTMIDNLSSTQIENIFKPIFYAKSTAGVRSTLFNTLATTINSLTGGDYAITSTSTTFVDGNDEDQAQEICNVIKQFLVVGRNASNVEDIDKTELGKLLNIIKTNAYRTVLSGKTNQGILKNVFDGLYDKIRTTYPDIDNVVGDKQVYEIDFEVLFEIVESITSAANDSFIGKLSDMLSTNVDETDLGNLIDSITNETTEDEIASINNLFDSIEELGVDVLTEDTKNMINEHEDVIKTKLNENTNIPDETKDRILNFFGIVIED